MDEEVPIEERKIRRIKRMFNLFTRKDRDFSEFIGTKNPYRNIKTKKGRPKPPKILKLLCPEILSEGYSTPLTESEKQKFEYEWHKQHDIWYAEYKYKRKHKIYDN